MSYDQALAGRVRKALGSTKGIAEKQMFGGICFLLRGRMCCGIVKDRLVVRVGLDEYDRILARSDVRPMDFTGKPLRGFVYVVPQGVRNSATLAAWVARGVRYVESLPGNRRPKKSRGPARGAARSPRPGNP
jgi:hypothetical protein